MCVDSWLELVNNCLVAPPLWLVLWARVGPYLWVIPLVFLVGGGFRVLQLFFQDEIDHLCPGWIRGKVARDGWTRIWFDYRSYTFLILIVGSLLVAYGLFHLRNPVDLLQDMGAEGSVWKLTPTAVAQLFFYVKLGLVSGGLWVLVGLLSLAILIIDPYGYHKFVLEPLVRSIDWLELKDVNKKVLTRQPWEANVQKIIRTASICFASDGKTATTVKDPKDYQIETSEDMKTVATASNAEGSETKASQGNDSQPTWIMVGFIPGKGLPGRSTAVLTGQGETEPSKRFIFDGSKDPVSTTITVQSGEEFHVGEERVGFRFS